MAQGKVDHVLSDDYASHSGVLRNGHNGLKMLCAIALVGLFVYVLYRAVCVGMWQCGQRPKVY